MSDQRRASSSPWRSPVPESGHQERLEAVAGDRLAESSDLVAAQRTDLDRGPRRRIHEGCDIAVDLLVLERSA